MESLIGVLQQIQEIVWGPPNHDPAFDYRAVLYSCGWVSSVCASAQSDTLYFEKEEGQGVGDVSAFASLCTALAATIGQAALLAWPLPCAWVGRVRFSGCGFRPSLAWPQNMRKACWPSNTRSIDENGEVAGGPMYYIEQGMGMKWKWLAKMFAFFGAVTALMGCGTFPQVNAITESVSNAFNVPIPLVGAVVTIATAAVIIGGIKSISSVAEYTLCR